MYMREKILTFLERNAKIDIGELAIMVDASEADVLNELEAMEQERIICGYHTLIDWDKVGVEKATALIVATTMATTATAISCQWIFVRLILSTSLYGMQSKQRATL